MSGPQTFEPGSEKAASSFERKKREGAPRWMVTFADLMALLFAMFVLILSFAEVNSDSFRRNAGSLRTAFNQPPGQIPSKTVDITLDQRESTDEPEDLNEWKENTLYQIRAALAQQIKESTAIVVETDSAIIIRFPDTTAFASGSYELRRNIYPVLDKVADILRKIEGDVEVSGHTDDVPISTARIRSNWDLSTARAVSVVHHLVEHNLIKSARITAQGYADSRPLVPNNSPRNRATNRRVEISIALPDTPENKILPEILR